jgi:hypothetical protein
MSANDPDGDAPNVRPEAGNLPSDDGWAEEEPVGQVLTSASGGHERQGKSGVIGVESCLGARGGGARGGSGCAGDGRVAGRGWVGAASPCFLL